MNWLVSITPWLSHYSVVVMTLLFVGLAVHTYWPARKSDMERRGSIPFREDV